MSKKFDLKASLSKSVEAEANHIEKRFAVAEGLLGQNAEKSNPVPPKEKVVRDTFSMPLSDYELIKSIQNSWLRFGISATRSEIIRAGVIALSMAGEEEVKRTLGALVKLKPGRGKNS